MMVIATNCDPAVTGSAAFVHEIRNALRDDLLIPSGCDLIGESNGTSNVGAIKTTLAASNHSFPVCTVGPRWWQVEAHPLHVPNARPGGSHAVVVLDMDDEKVEVYDPFVAMQDPEGGQARFDVPIPAFLRAWEDERPVREILWFDARAPIQEALNA